MKLYGFRGSGNCLKVKWVCDRLAIPYDWVELEIFEGATRTPDFLARSPMGQVPVAEFAGGQCLAQSGAIMLHLAEGSALIPEEGFARAQMMEWMFWEQNLHEPSVAALRADVRFRGKAADPEKIKRGEACLALMNAHLADRNWFVGGALSLADIALVAYTRWAHEGGFDLAAYPAVQAWVARCEDELGVSQ